MEYYLAVKENGILKFAAKGWNQKKKHPECGIPVPERQPWYVLTHKWILGVKEKITNLQSTIPEKLGNKENPKRDIHESPWEEEIEKIS